MFFFSIWRKMSCGTPLKMLSEFFLMGRFWTFEIFCVLFLVNRVSFVDFVGLSDVCYGP